MGWTFRGAFRTLSKEEDEMEIRTMSSHLDVRAGRAANKIKR